MRQYIYSPAEAGLKEWPSGELRLEGIEVTTDPDAADIYVCPGPLMLFTKPEDLDRFPYIEGREAQHVFFDVSDWDTTYTRRDVILIRCNMKRFMQDAHPNGISFAWPVDDFEDVVSVPEGGFKYDISFHGWNLSSPVRYKAPRVCLDDASLKCDIACYADFTGYIYHQPEGIRRRAEFRRSMKESRIALCPESIAGVFPYRMFEAMSAGRVPLLVGSNYVLPFEREIPYSEFLLTCPAKDADRTAIVAKEFLSSHSDAQIVEMGLRARYWWDKWLRRDDWPRTMAYAVTNKINELKAAQCA